MVGVVTVRRTLDPLSTVSYGFMVLLIERYSRIPGAFFDKERSLQYNVASAVFLLAPVTDFMGALICYRVYAECDAPLLPETMPLVPEYGAVPGAEPGAAQPRTF